MLYVGISITVLAGFASLAVDWGRVQLTKTELQRAADAGARAAASQLPLGIAAVQTAAVTFAGDNAADSYAVAIDPNNDVEFGTWDSTAKTFTVLTGTARTSANAVRVTARRIAARGTAVPLIFGQVVGVSSYDATKSAIASYAPTTVDYSLGFTGAPNLALNGIAAISGTYLQLINATSNKNASAWYTTKVPISAFTANFSFSFPSGTADGFTFCLQKASTTNVGGVGLGLGSQGMTSSVAIKFDIYSNSGEGVSSTGLYLNGATPTNVGSLDMSPSGVLLKSGHVMNVSLVYDGTTLTETVTDTTTNAVFSTSYVVNIPLNVGATTGYVGFTGATGGSTSVLNIRSWTYTTPGSLATVK